MQNNDEFLPLKRKINILLAEDDSGDCLLFEEALAELPVNVSLTTVGNGEELIKWLNKKNNAIPDVLFLDLNMPRKNGFAALGEIKRNPNMEDLPVMIFSTSNEEEMIKQVFNDAAHYYIRKPADFSKLKTLIYKVLTLIEENKMSLPNKENFILSSDS